MLLELNRAITWDLNGTDLCRIVKPGSLSARPPAAVVCQFLTNGTIPNHSKFYLFASPLSNSALVIGKSFCLWVSPRLGVNVHNDPEPIFWSTQARKWGNSATSP